MADGSVAHTPRDLLLDIEPVEFCTCESRVYSARDEQHVVDLLLYRGPSYIDRMCDLLRGTPAGRDVLKAIKQNS
jgi:hypothetical protein